MASSESELLFFAARLRAIKKRPYFTSILFSLRHYEKPIGTLAVDKSWRVYYDPEKIREWGVEKTSVVLLHEIGHLIRDHHRRFTVKGVKNSEFPIANVASDCEINDDLVEEGLDLPITTCLPTKFGLKNGDLWENYFDSLIEKAEKQEIEICGGDSCKNDSNCPSNKSSSGNKTPKEKETDGKNNSKQKSGSANKTRIHVDCGSCAGGDKRDYEEEEDPTGKDSVTGQEQELIRRQVAREVQDACSKQPGTVPDGLKRWADAYLKSEVRWEKELRSSVRVAAFFKRGCDDFTYKKPSRRSSVFPDFILPSMHKPTPEVAIIIDTSGSMDRECLTSCLVETKAVLKLSNLLSGVRVITADAAVHFAKKVTNAKQIQLLGGGGTDMREPLNLIANQKKNRPSVVIVMTDGYTPWPDHNPLPKSKTIVLLVGGNTDTKSVPSWAKTIVVTKNQAYAK